MSTYVVSREDLAHNVRILKEKAGGTPIWAVVKADGYGLGVAAFSRELHTLGIEDFCVTEPWEAEAIRSQGILSGKILMLRQLSDPEQIRSMEKADVIFTVGSLEAANRLQASAEGPVDVHIKIDTGMGRYGFRPEELASIVTLFHQAGKLRIRGIYTHFNSAFCNDKATKSQFARFQGVVEALRKEGCHTGMVHCCNSAAFLKFPEMHMDGVRLGSALLGRMSFATELRPLGKVETSIEEVRHLPKGHSTGYGAIWKSKRDTTLAIIPIGWCNGLHVSCKEDRSRISDCIRGMLRELKNILKRPKAYVIVSGKSCPMVGAIGSLHCAVDVTGVECKMGQPVEMQISPMHVKGMEVVFR